MSNLRTHYNFKLDFRKAEQHTGCCCCCCCCVAFAQISGWLIKWSSCWLIFIVSFNTLYNSYYPARHGLQYVHIFVLANVFVFDFFIYPGGFFTFFYNVLLGFRGVLAISASGVLLEFVFFGSFSQVALMFCFLWWHYIPFCWAFLSIPAFCWWIGFRCFPTSALFLFCFQLLLGSSFWSFPLFFCLCYFSFHFLNTLLFDLLPWIPPGFHWLFPSRCCFRSVSFFWLVGFSSYWSVCGPAWFFSSWWYLLSRGTRFHWGERWLGFLVGWTGLFSGLHWR